MIKEINDILSSFELEVKGVVFVMFMGKILFDNNVVEVVIVLDIFNEVVKDI